MTHIVGNHLLSGPVDVAVVGCGGTGSAVVPGLAKIHRSMVALGHPGGLRVTIWDDDDVSLTNTVRQNFFEPDVGHNKAQIMANRMNIAHAPARFACQAVSQRFCADTVRYNLPDVIFGCVDSKASRRSIHEVVAASRDAIYVIDCGNERASGQVVVGQGGKAAMELPDRLPMVGELFPEILNGPENDAPSCSARQSISRQGVLTNAMAASWALAWFDAAVRYGQVEWSAVFFNLEVGRVTSVPATPEAWAKLGYHAAPVSVSPGRDGAVVHKFCG